MIYFIRSQNQIKIGYSKEPLSRLAACKTWRPDARIVMTLRTPDDARSEAELKRYFSQYSQGGEWFSINLPTAVRGLLDLHLLGGVQSFLEMEEIPEIHPEFFDFLQGASKRDFWTEAEVMNAWREQHHDFLRDIKKMTVQEMIKVHEEHWENGLRQLRADLDFA